MKIYVVNYTSNRYLQWQRIQDAAWAKLSGDFTLTVCSFSEKHVLPILRDLNLDNEADICSVLRERRGDGLWAWKAILMYHVYKNIAQEDDIVFYMDSGARPILPFDSIWQHVRDYGYFFVRVSAFETVSKVRAWLKSQPSMNTKTSLLDDLNFSSRLWTKPFPPAPGNEYGLPRCVLDRLEGGGGSLSDACAALLDMEQVCGGFQGYLKRENNDKILKDLLANTSLHFLDDVVRSDTERRFLQ
jgi:hypothetical protein